MTYKRLERAGALYPNRKKSDPSEPDLIGDCTLDERRRELRGWRVPNGIELRVEADGDSPAMSGLLPTVREGSVYEGVVESEEHSYRVTTRRDAGLQLRFAPAPKGARYTADSPRPLEVGPVPISRELVTYLALARTQHDITRPATIEIEDIHRAEEALEVRFPLELLAVCAAVGPTLDAVVAQTEEARERTRIGSAAIVVQPWFCDTQHLITAHSTPDREGDLATWHVGDEDYCAYVYNDFEGARTDPLSGDPSFLAYLRWRFSRALDRPEPTVDFEAMPFDGARESAQPRLVRTAAVIQTQHAIHPKFGRGLVLEVLPDRLRIDFGQHGVRTLLNRFVTLE